MELLKILLVVIGLFYLYYCTGIVIKKILKSRFESVSTTLLYGFVTNFAIFELINLPFMIYFKQATNIMYAIFLMMNIVLIVLSYIIKPINEYRMIQEIKKLKNKKENKKNLFYFLFVILIIGFQIYNSAFLFKQDADDSFYISWANEAKELENLYDMDPSVGAEGTDFDTKYQFNIWEIYGGFIARLVHINVATLFHTVYPIFYIILSYFAYHAVIKKLVKEENIGLAMFFLAILLLWTGVSTKFKGVFLLGRIYQGKAILANIIIPFVMAKFIKNKNLEKEDGVILVLTYIASLAVTPMTISILSLLYGLFIILLLVRKDYKEFKKAIWLMVPIIIIAILYITFAYVGNNTLGEATKTGGFSQKEDWEAFLGEGKTIFVLYLISILVIMIKGNQEQKETSVFFPILMLLIVFNPLLTNIYIKLITKSTYWRLYWLLPIEITIVVAIMIFHQEMKEVKTKYIFGIFMTFLIMISGKYMYTKERGFSKFENFEKIPQYIIDETNYIMENSTDKTRVVAPGEPWESCMMRQYSSKIILLYSRNAYIFDQEDRKEFINLYQEVYGKEYYDTEKINKLQEQYQIEWLILPKNKPFDSKEELGYTLVTENQNNYILKAKK